MAKLFLYLATTGERGREGGREGATLGEAASRARLLSSEGVVDSVRRPQGEGWGVGERDGWVRGSNMVGQGMAEQNWKD